MFDILDKILTFEDESNQQADNADSSDAGKLDSQLESLAKETGSEDSKDSGGADDTGESGDDSLDSDGGDDGSDNSDGQQTDDDSSGDDDDSKPKTGAAPRKLTLYAEFNRIHNVLREALESCESKLAINNATKNCIAQLKQVLIDTRFILSNFTERSEEDIMVQMEMIKRRSTLALELLKRQVMETKENRQNGRIFSK